MSLVGLPSATSLRIRISVCHSVIVWPFIPLTNLAYPRLVSRTNKLVRLSGFPEEKYDTLEYSKVKCYSGDSVRLQNIYSIGHKKRQHWSSTGPGGGQVKCLLDAFATSKSKGITGDHVVFSFVSRWIQPLQRWKHPAFRYEGTKDPTWLSPEAMSHSAVVKRSCKVLDDFNKSLVLPALFSAVNPPKRTWVSVKKHC